MPELVLLSLAQMGRIEPFFPCPGGLPRVDDRRVVSGIVTVIRQGLQREDAPTGHGPPRTLTTRFVRRSRLGVFARVFAAVAAMDTSDREDPAPMRTEAAGRIREAAGRRGAGWAFVTLSGEEPDLLRVLEGDGPTCLEIVHQDGTITGADQDAGDQPEDGSAS